MLTLIKAILTADGDDNADDDQNGDHRHGQVGLELDVENRDADDASADASDGHGFDDMGG